MAKRGTLTHRKTRHLARLLGMPLPCALGVLEALWHVTAQSAQRGDIGKLEDQEIADSMWIESDATALIDALVESKWLARHDSYRLVVVGWSEHADDAVRKYLKRNHFVFWDGEPAYPRHGETEPANVAPSTPKVETSSDTTTQKLDKSSHVAKSRAMECLPEPEPEPEPVPVPKPDISPPATQAPQGRPRVDKPESLEEVNAEGERIGLPPGECEIFWNHFRSNGWKVGGKAPMRDWTAALAKWKGTWQSGQDKSKSGSSPGQEKLSPVANEDYVLKSIGDLGVMPMDVKDPTLPFDAPGWFREKNLNIPGRWAKYCEDFEAGLIQGKAA